MDTHARTHLHSHSACSMSVCIVNNANYMLLLLCDANTGF